MNVGRPWRRVGMRQAVHVQSCSRFSQNQLLLNESLKCLTSPDPKKAAACRKWHAWADHLASPHGRTTFIVRRDPCTKNSEEIMSRINERGRHQVPIHAQRSPAIGTR